MADGPCSICQRPADREWLTPLTQCLVTCARCGRYRITYSLDEWWKEVRSKNAEHLLPGEEQLLPYLSAHTRQSVEPAVVGQTGEHAWKHLAEGHRTTGVTRKVSNLLDYFANQSELDPIRWTV